MFAVLPALASLQGAARRGCLTAAACATQGVKVKWIAAGPAACHSVIGDAEGRCWTWGRNEVSCRATCCTGCQSGCDHACTGPG